MLQCPSDRKPPQKPDTPSGKPEARSSNSPEFSLHLVWRIPHFPGAVICTTSELREFAGRMRRSDWVALDTEADSLHAYPEKLCLLQVAIPGEAVLIDPLADVHLEPVWEAMDEHEIIFHAADYDLRLLFQCHHFKPRRIFDTMWAARLLGEPRFGLNDVLTKHLGITLEKGAQKANWGRRPLTDKMIQYALNDVLHLREIEQVLRSRLAELGRLEWHRQICDRLIEDCCQPDVVDDNAVWRIKGHDKLDPLGMAVLRELWHWREKDAFRTGRPPFFIFKHELLSSLAAEASEKKSVRGLTLPHFLTPKRRADLLAAVRRGLDVPEAERPQPIRVHSRRMTRSELDEADRITQRRDARGTELGIDPTLIASKSTLFALGRNDPGAWDDLLPWQHALLAD
jgi:ribonuclease D